MLDITNELQKITNSFYKEDEKIISKEIKDTEIIVNNEFNTDNTPTTIFPNGAKVKISTVYPSFNYDSIITDLKSMGDYTLINRRNIKYIQYTWTVFKSFKVDSKYHYALKHPTNNKKLFLCDHSYIFQVYPKYSFDNSKFIKYIPGSIVQIIDKGGIYNLYDDMATSMKLDKWIKDKRLEEDIINGKWKVLTHKKHLSYNYTVYAIESMTDNNIQIIIRNDSIKLWEE